MSEAINETTTVATATPKTPSENAIRLGMATGLGIAVAAMAWIMLPGITWQVLLGLIFFGTALDIVLEWAEIGTATGRTMMRLVPWGAGVLVFIAIRIAGGYIFGLPIAAVYGQVYGTAEGVRNFGQSVALEVLFSIIGVGLAWMAINKPRSRDWLYVMAVMSFFVVLYQAKAPEMNNAIARVLKAGEQKTAQTVAQKATKMEQEIAPVFGRSVIGANLYTLEAGGFQFADRNLTPGNLVLALGESRTQDGFVLMKVRLPNKSGDFISAGPIAWVDSRAFEWGVKVGADNKPADNRLARNAE